MAEHRLENRSFFADAARKDRDGRPDLASVRERTLYCCGLRHVLQRKEPL